jgi:dipeptidyl aminopeptidase/acylaminoacyl peptidase
MLLPSGSNGSRTRPVKAEELSTCLRLSPAQRLVGPWPDTRDLWHARSPLHEAAGFSCPVIFFQGDEDKVVPPDQAEAMVDALRERGIPVAHVVFEGEGHGFRRAENIRDSLAMELHFYGRVLGFEPADPAPDLEIHHL